MEADQARVQAQWGNQADEVRYGRLRLSVTHPEIQTITQQGIIEYVMEWDRGRVVGIATRPDTRLMCHPLLYERNGTITESDHGWGTATTPLMPPPWYTLEWLTMPQRYIIAAASRAYRMGVMDRFTICCWQTVGCRCPLHELLMSSLEEGEIGVGIRDSQVRGAINIIITSVQSSLAMHRKLARCMLMLQHHPAERVNRTKHHFLAAYCTIKELQAEGLDIALSTSNLRHRVHNMIQLS